MSSENISDAGEWAEVAAMFEQDFGATAGDDGALRFRISDVPATAWRGSSSMRDGGEVVHLAAPVFSRVMQGRSGQEPDVDSTSAASGPNSATSNITLSDATGEEALLERLGIDPKGPDLIRVVRAAEDLPLGGIRLLGNLPHVHFSAHLPADPTWIGKAARLIASEARDIMEGRN